MCKRTKLTKPGENLTIRSPLQLCNFDILGILLFADQLSKSKSSIKFKRVANDLQKSSSVDNVDNVGRFQEAQ